MDGELQEDVIDRCIQRLLQGEPLDRVLRSHPDQQPELRAALEPAIALLQSSTPNPSPRTEYAAMNAMMRQVRTEADRPELPGVIRWLGSLRARPLAYQALAVLAAIALFGSIGLGASAATGSAPQPLQDILGIGSNSSTVLVSGSIVTIDAHALVVRTVAGNRSIEISPETLVRRGDERIGVTSLTPGEAVSVTATEMRDGGLVAREVLASLPPTPTNTAAIGVPGLPQSDDDPTGTPHEGDAGDDDHGDDHGQGVATSTPESDDRHDDDADHAETPAASATPKSDDDHKTPEDAEKTSESEHDDSTNTPESGDHHD